MEKRSKYSTSRSGAKDEDIFTNSQVQLVGTMDGARGRFDESGFFIREIMNLIDLFGVHDDVFSKAPWYACNSESVEGCAEERLSATTVEADFTLGEMRTIRYSR